MTKTERVYRIVKANPGIRSCDIAAKTGMRSAVISALAHKTPRIRCAGTARKRRYFIAEVRPAESRFSMFCKLYDKCHAQGVRAGRAC